MSPKNFHFLVLFFLPLVLFSQTFYRTGADTNIVTSPRFGLLLAGGGGDNNEGMRWLTQRADGGDVVVLRASGGDGYNNYIYSQLGEKVNSVTTIVIGNFAHANRPEVCEAVKNAELIFIAGGNQWNYYNHWKGSCLLRILNEHVYDKSAPIGGTSAGLAILGEVVYTAQNNSVFSSEALANPYDLRVTLANDFLNVPFMENIVTDSHYDNRNRNGRHVAFLARMYKDWGLDAHGIGVNEHTAIAVDENGIARVFGDPSYPDYAYFLRGNSAPEVCEPDTALSWNNNGDAVTVYRIKGNRSGNGYFDLKNWSEAEGGHWQRWYVENGIFFQDIYTGTIQSVYDNLSKNIKFYPVPAKEYLFLEYQENRDLEYISVYNSAGQLMMQKALGQKNINYPYRLDIEHLTPGFYLIHFFYGGEVFSKKFLKE